MPFTLAKFVRALFKGVGHRYIKRIPYMTPKGKRYRYIYKVEHTHRGKHAFDEAHLVEGTKFALSTESGAEFHGHITVVDGDKVTYTIDDGPRKGEVVETTKAELAATLNEVHGVKDKLSAERAKVSALLEDMKAGNATAKQIARVRRRLLALGGVEKEAVTPEPESRERSAVKKKAAQMLAEVERFKEIAKQEPRKKYKRLSASKGEYSAVDSDGLYRAIRDNIKNVRESGDYTHAKEQISLFLASRALNSEQGYLLNRLLREINPLDQTPEQLRAEEAEEERFARDDAESDGSTETSVLVAFHDLEASREKETKTPDLKALREKILGEYAKNWNRFLDSPFLTSWELSAFRTFLQGKPLKGAKRNRLNNALANIDGIFGRMIREVTKHGEDRKMSIFERSHERNRDLAEFLGVQYDDPRDIQEMNRRSRADDANFQRISVEALRRMKIDKETTFKDIGEQLADLALDFESQREREVKPPESEAETPEPETKTPEPKPEEKERRERILEMQRVEQRKERERKREQEARVARNEERERGRKKRNDPRLENESLPMDVRGDINAEALLRDKDYLSYAAANRDSAIYDIESERAQSIDDNERAISRAARLFAEDTRTKIKLKPADGNKTGGTLATFRELAPPNVPFAIGYDPKRQAIVVAVLEGPAKGQGAKVLDVSGLTAGERSIRALDILDALRAGNAQELLEGLVAGDLHNKEDPDSKPFYAMGDDLLDRVRFREDFNRGYEHALTADVGKKIHELKDTIRLEGLAARPHVQSDSVDNVSAAPRVSGFEDLSAKDLKGLKGAISAEMSEHPRWGATMSGVMRDGDILGTTDGKNIVFMKTRGSQEDRTSTDPKTGQQLEGTPPPFVQAIPESNPVMTLDRSAIKAITSALVGVKGKGVEEGFYVDLDLNGDAYDISVGSKGGKKYKVASIPASDSGAPKFRVNPQYLKAALARAGDKASVTLQSGKAPLLIEGESGLNTVIMGITRVD